jgi:hypothetical protein
MRFFEQGFYRMGGIKSPFARKNTRKILREIKKKQLQAPTERNF